MGGYIGGILLVLLLSTLAVTLLALAYDIWSSKRINYVSRFIVTAVIILVVMQVPFIIGKLVINIEKAIQHG